MKKIAIFAALTWAVFIFVMYVWAQQDTGTYTEHDYLYKPSYSDYGTAHYNKRMESFDRADRALAKADLVVAGPFIGSAGSERANTRPSPVG